MSNFIKQLPVGLSGVNADYWVKEEVKINHRAKHILVRVYGYLNETEYNNGATPIKGALIDYPIENWIETVPDTHPQAEEGDTIEVEHNEYDAIWNNGINTQFDAKLNNHIKTEARNTILADAIDD